MDGGGSKRVFVHVNAPDAESHVLLVSEGVTMSTFKRIAGEKVGLEKVRTIFLASGQEVQSLEDVQHNDNLYVSSGGAFYRNNAAAKDRMHIAVLGSGGVGKSAITLRYVRDIFVTDWDATIEDAYRKTARVDDSIAVMEILDTAGQEDFSALRTQWMSEKDAYLFVFSLTDRDSLEQLYAFADLIEQVNVDRPSAPPIVLVGNKKDIVDADPTRRQVTRDDVMALQRECEEAMQRLSEQQQQQQQQQQRRRDDGVSRVIYMEASASSGENVQEVFEQIVRTYRTVGKVEQQEPKKWCFLF